MLLGFLTRSVFAGTLPLSRTARSTANAVPTLPSLSVFCVHRFRRGLCLVVFTFLLTVVVATFSVPKTNFSVIASVKTKTMSVDSTPLFTRRPSHSYC